jgi:parallel beta-helix repeat protein
MLFSSWLRNWKCSLERRSTRNQTRHSQRTVRPRSNCVRLALELLEERCVPSLTITVTTPSDDPTTPIAGQITLRDAINKANTNPGSTINFAPSAYQFLVKPTAPLPAITGAGTTINGATGSSSLPQTNLDGSQTSAGTEGLVVDANNVTIEELDIENFPSTGIDIQGGNGSTVENNDIGIVYANGNRAPNSGGINVNGNAAGAVITENNISDNTDEGIQVASAKNTVIRSNSINSNGLEGILVVQDNGPTNTLIGGEVDGEGNTIELNGARNNSSNSGIDIFGTSGNSYVSDTVFVQGNTIDFNKGNGITNGYNDEAGPGNGSEFGISIGGILGGMANLIENNGGNGVETVSAGDQIQGNTIATNGADGVDERGSSADIERNSIFNNAVQGIFVNAGGTETPSLTSTTYTVFSNNPTLTIQGNLPIAADGTSGDYTLEFFANEPSSNPQGETELGESNVNAVVGSNNSFTATFTPAAGSISSPTQVTATATFSGLNTSEFSNAILATALEVPSLTTPTASPNTVIPGGTRTVRVGVSSSNNGSPVNEGTVTFSLVDPSTGATVASDTGVTVQNGTATDTHFEVPYGTSAGKYNLVAQYTDPGGSFANTSSTANNAVTVRAAPPPPPAPSSPPPPSLNVPPLLAFLDSLLREVETTNGDGTETIKDSLFGIQLLVATFDQSGNLESVTLFGVNVTFLFK